MEALKNNNVDRWTDECSWWCCCSLIIFQTEEYLHKLGGKITAAKNYQEAEEAANAAVAAARAQIFVYKNIDAYAQICLHLLMSPDRRKKHFFGVGTIESKEWKMVPKMNDDAHPKVPFVDDRVTPLAG